MDVHSLMTTSLVLSIATNGVTILMIAYRLWYVAVSGIYWIQRLTME